MNPPTSQSDYLEIAIGALVEVRRKRKHMTQQKLAAKVKISQPRLSRIESARSWITLGELRAFEAVLGGGLESAANKVVSIARKGSGAMTAAGVRIETEELIPLVAKRWNR